MMLSIRACATPEPKKPMLPKRVARARRVMESKRMESFRMLQDKLKEVSKSEKDLIKSLFNPKFFEDEEEDE
jgi:hypothetical protein